MYNVLYRDMIGKIIESEISITIDITNTNTKNREWAIIGC